MPSFDFWFKYRGSHTEVTVNSAGTPGPFHTAFLRLSNLASSPQAEVVLVGTWLPSQAVESFAGTAYRCRNSWKRMRLGKPWRQMRIPSRTPLQRSWSSTRRGSSFPACRGDSRVSGGHQGRHKQGCGKSLPLIHTLSLSLEDSGK